MTPDLRATRQQPIRTACLVAATLLGPTGAVPLGAQDTADDVALRPPTPQDVAAWRDHILPDPTELRWESIPWLPTFGAGLQAASARGRPLLLYAMNGHPLGCT